MTVGLIFDPTTYKTDCRDDEADDQSDVNQAARYTKDHAGQPQEQQNGGNRKKHPVRFQIAPLSYWASLKIFTQVSRTANVGCLPGCRYQYVAKEVLGGVIRRVERTKRSLLDGPISFSHPR